MAANTGPLGKVMVIRALTDVGLGFCPDCLSFSSRGGEWPLTPGSLFVPVRLFFRSP
jgi:hypothetical protein